VNDHAPLISGYRVVHDPTLHHDVFENQPRCMCGWRGVWDRKIQAVDAELRRHLDRFRPAT
jgi:hypothetical protein